MTSTTTTSNPETPSAGEVPPTPSTSTETWGLPLPETRSRLQVVTLAGVFLAAALAVQSLRVWTPLIGTIVNALFIVLYHRAGLHGAMLLAVATPVGAALTGVLHVIFLGMVPVIAIGNVLLIGIYHLSVRSSAGLRIFAPAAGKALFIGLSG